MSTINVKQIKYNYGKFYVNSPNIQGGEEVTNAKGTKTPTIDEDDNFSPDSSNIYFFDESIDTIKINLPVVNEPLTIIMFFTTSDNPNVSITSELPIKYYKGFSIEPNIYYEINCLFNGKEWIIAYGIIE